MTDDLGPRIKAARKRHGLSQRELATLSGVGVRTVRDIEAGRGEARPRTAIKLLVGSGALCTVRVLGPVEIERAGRTVLVGPGMEAGLLTVLALRPGVAVPRTEIAAALWPGARPRSWPNLVQTYVSRLRKRLAPDRITAVGSGYRLDIDATRVDAARFMAAASTAEPAALEDALREWRGPIGGDAPAGVPADPAAVDTESARVDAAVRFAGLAAGAGRRAAAVELLAPLLAVYPAHPALRHAFADLVAAPDDPLSEVDAPSGHAVAVNLLCQVSATTGGTPLPVAGTFGRTVLAALAVEPGRVVTVSRLIELLWDGAPPATAREQVHTQVYRLRRALGTANTAIETVPIGYRLRTERVHTDIATVTGTLAGARAAMSAGRPADAIREYRRAEALWQEPVLGGVTAAFAAAYAPRLTEWHQAVAEERIAAELECAPVASILPELDAMIEDHPLREELHRLRMLALYRAGRRVDALRAFGAARTILRRELGLDPSLALRELEAEILNEGVAVPGPPVLVPAQLPPAPPGFTGRLEQSAVLRRLLTRPSGAAARVAVVSGMPGIGKTALAVSAATEASGHFPDGRLFANLSGAAEMPRAPGAVLGDLLRALGVTPSQLPDDVAGRAAVLRTLTAGRRVLLVLDDAADEAQVEPLLLAGTGCTTLVTSRPSLPGLDASCRVRLDPLDDAAARDVLAAVAGHDRIAADPTAVTEILQACGGMPLALRIVGARLATRDDLTLADVAARLRDEDRRLGELAAGRRSVRASLAGSHRLLSPPARAALAEISRLGAGATNWMIAALLDLPAATAEEVTDELVGLHMLEAAASPAGLGPRFRPHDLVRVYAAAGARTEAEVASLAGLVARAVTLAATARTALTGAEPSRLVSESLDERHAADEWLRVPQESPERWFAAERAVLLALVHAAADCALPNGAAALLESTMVFLVRLNLLDDLAAAARRVAETTSVAGTAARVHATIALAQVSVHRTELSEVCVCSPESCPICPKWIP